MSGNGSGERIARVAATVVEAPLDEHMRAYGSTRVAVMLVRITDGDGRTGTGFTYTLGLGAGIVAAMVREVLGPEIAGTAPADWDETSSRLAAATRRIGRGVFVPALSALDIAMHDLRGIQAGLPLYRLLGREATRVPIYGSGRSSNRLDDDALLDGARRYLDEGYPAMKIRVGARDPAADVARVAAVRDVVGPGVRLMVDANEQLRPDTAAALVTGLAEVGVDWIEEPFVAEDVAAHAELAAGTGIPVAVGEHLVGPYEFDTYARGRAAALFQPDAALAGGVSAALRIAAVARAHGVPIAWHSLPELHVHLAMDDPIVSYVEHFPILDPLLAAPLSRDGGTVTAPGTPGHGIVWDEGAIAAMTVA